MPGRMLFRYSREEVAKHNTPSDLWIIHNNKVYDVSEFASDHPGGPDLIKEWAGKDVSKILLDPTSHKHSDSAYEVLAELCIGEIVVPPNNINSFNSLDKSTQLENIHLDEKIGLSYPETDISHDLKIENFLDLNKPLFSQMFNCKFTKEFYLKQIHQPRHLSYSAKLFDNPWLELLTKTPWYVIPLVWLPIASYHIFMASELGSRPVTILFFIGIGLWTLLEYGIHRFLFHVDTILPDHPYALCVHFTVHGIHHYLPMDKLRLVMPPILGFAIAVPIIQVVYSIFPVSIGHGLISGAVIGYIGYDLTHYHLHHAKPFGKHLREMKTYHLAHHYKNYELGYGITSKIWDRFFGTLLE